MRFALLLIVAAAPAAAQTIPPGRDLAVGGAIVLAGAALSPLDRSVRDVFQNPLLQSSHALHETAAAFNLLGIPGTAVLTAGAYVGGQLGHDRGLATAGFHGMEALALSTVVTVTLKGLIGRARPDASPTRQYDFRFGTGFTHDERGSLPSLHSASAFSVAAVASVESARWWPHSGWVGPVAYTTAGMVAISRLYSNRHWLSDVLGGAAVGIASGLLVSHFSESHPHNALDRAFLP